MFEILVKLWKQFKVLKQTDTSLYPDIVKCDDGFGIS